MKSFFNGVDNAELAGLNLSNNGLNIIVKQYMGNAEVVATMRGILDSNKPEFDKEVELVSTAMDACESLREYSMHEVRATLTRRINAMSREGAEKHGFTSYLRFSRGKVKEADLALEHQA